VLRLRRRIRLLPARPTPDHARPRADRAAAAACEPANPEGFDYGGVQHLRAEAHEQLAKIRPRTLGQAGRVSGNLGRERIARSLNGEVFAVFAESVSDIDSAPAR
jgi:hypothetical protein